MRSFKEMAHYKKRGALAGRCQTSAFGNVRCGAGGVISWANKGLTDSIEVVYEVFRPIYGSQP
jgi:hypothetical protein